MNTLPFNRAWSAPNQLTYLQESLTSGQTAGDGLFTKRSSKWLSDHLQGPKVLLTPSCTAALEMCALLLNLLPDDEVIVPSYTFVTSASAFALFGARLVFADIRPDTLTLDPDQVRRLISPRTRAVVTVHYAGIAHDPTTLVDLCAEHQVTLIEDAAHALGASFKGRPLGTFGSLSTYSFHESKNFSSGEGGALAINDASPCGRAEILREKGTNRSALLRKEVGKYTWVDVGSSYLASDLTAAALLAQFDDYSTIQNRRHAIWNRYQTELADWTASRSIRQPFVPEGCQHSAHLYYLVFPDRTRRDGAIEWLRTHQVEAYFHYLPLHLSPAGQRVGDAPLGAPVSESISERLFRLPLYPSLTDDQQDNVIQALKSLPA